MKNLLIATTLFAICFMLACTKETGTVSNTPTPVGGGSRGAFSHTNARLSGDDYSQSISVDTANSMISSYLTSINYPNSDTALRSLSFDADTLRAYLLNSNIVTLKFMIAHQPAYKNSHNGEYSGMKPGALTMIVVGLNEANGYVLNNRNGVYEHFSPCPTICYGTSSAFVQ